MPIKATFLVPNYYKNFQCKGSSCRYTCCKGWNITISLNEYLHLMSLQCSKKIRQKLDRSFVVLPNPNKDRYAIVKLTDDLNCPLQLNNGYCQLHLECGHKVLPSLCQAYP